MMMSSAQSISQSTRRARWLYSRVILRPTAASSNRPPAIHASLGTLETALVFDDYPSMKKAIDDPDLEVTADHVLVLRNAGPQGGPGMAEWGMLPIPTKLVKQGVRDMVRISDARMSGTSYGACILHVAPESYVGGPLALVRNGDRISLDVAARTINLDVPETELVKRRAEWKQPQRRFERGYGWMFSRHIKQANEGCDFDFLETSFGGPVGEPSTY
ncbi:dihydroxyacid dehydratase/phosphogluconate dehydratase [Bradyrhizobium sp. USDA 4522]